MKCLIAGFLSVCVAVSLLMTGCSSGGTDNTAQTDGPVTITIWHDKEDEVAQALQTELDTLAPDIVVKLEKKDGLTDSLKMVGNDPNSAPDMYFFAHDKIGVYAEMGILAPITDFVDKSTLDQYIPMTIEAATYKGKVYQLPLYFETLLYMYNRRYMSDNEVPSTTEELYKYMQENTKGSQADLSAHFVHRDLFRHADPDFVCTVGFFECRQQPCELGLPFYPEELHAAELCCGLYRRTCHAVV